MRVLSLLDLGMPHRGLTSSCAGGATQVFSLDAQRKIRWDDTAVDGLLQQFENHEDEADGPASSTISLVMNSFKARLPWPCC